MFSLPSSSLSSSSSSSPPATTDEETDFLDRIRNLRLPAPPSSSPQEREQDQNEVAHIPTQHTSVPVPNVATLAVPSVVPSQGVSSQSLVPRIVPLATLHIGESQNPPAPVVHPRPTLPSVRSSLSSLTAPQPAVTTTTALPDSSTSRHSTPMSLPSSDHSADVVLRAATPDAAKAPLPQPQLPVEPPPLPPAPALSTESDTVVPVIPPPTAASVARPVAARPPALTVTVLTEPPPGSSYPVVTSSSSLQEVGITASATDRAAPAPRAATGKTETPAVEVVAVKRQKKPLERRDVHLFRDSGSDSSEDDDVAPQKSRSANDLFDFLGNVVSTADRAAARKASAAPQPEQERKKRKRRLEQQREQPALVIRQEDVQRLDAAIAEKEAEVTTTAEPSMTSQSTNALTPDPKAHPATSASPATSPDTTPEKDKDAEKPAAAPKLQPPQTHRTHHRRCESDLTVDAPAGEGRPTANRAKETPQVRERHRRLHREEREYLEGRDEDSDIAVDAPSQPTLPLEDHPSLDLTKSIAPASISRSTFVRQLGTAFERTGAARPWQSFEKTSHYDPQSQVLSETAELTRRGFCKSGAFDEDLGSTLRSGSMHRETAGGRQAESDTVPECLYVTIRGMGPMHADINVVHPFARVWLVNSRTGENLLSAHGGAPFAITQLFDLRQRRSRAPFWDAELALPLNRPAFRNAPKEAVLLVEVLDICTETITGEFVPRSGMYPICWGYYYLYDRYGNTNIGVVADASVEADAAAADDDTQKENTGPTVHLQMFRFPLRTPWYTQLLASVLPPLWASRAVWAPFDYLSSGGVLQNYGRARTSNADDHDDADDKHRDGHNSAAVNRVGMQSRGVLLGVFAIFRMMRSRKVPYKAGMAISLRFVYDEMGVPPRVATATDYEEHLTRQLAAMAGNCVVPRLHDTPRGFSSRAAPGGPTTTSPNGPTRVPDPRRVTAELPYPRASLCVVDQEALGQTYERVGTAERCLPPTQIIQTCPVAGALTCMTFSHAGTVLAMGVARHLQHLIELRLPLLSDFPVTARMGLHTGHIYHVAFNADDTKLLSCSSDHTVRIWMGTDGYNFADVSPQMRQLSVSCVCTLPHRWPMYTATFHSFLLHRRRHTSEEYVITGGYSSKIVTWKLSDAPHSLLSSPNCASGRDKAATRASGPFGSPLESDGRQTCELVSRVSLADNAFTLEVASTNGSNRVWSIDSTGTVICWRATIDSDGFEMSVRMRSPELACTRLLVSPSTVLAFKPNSAAVFLFDATSGKPLRNKPPPVAADCANFALLPDGSGFAGGTTTGRLRCWNWETSTLFSCTSHQGYRGAEVQYPIDRIAWASGEHLVATASPAPCPEHYLNNVLLPQIRPPDEPGVVALPPFDLSQLEVTLVTIAGAPQPATGGAPPAIRLVDFVRLCGGDATAVERARSARAQRRQSASSPHSAVVVERFEEEEAEDPATVLSRAMAQVDAQLNSIVQFWRRAFAGTSRTMRGDDDRSGTATSTSADRYREADLDV